MLKVAILGANGFVGSRLLESLHLGNIAQVTPVVRSFTGLSRSARFDLPWQLADGRDQSALKSAFTQCDVVIDCLLGSPEIIIESMQPVYNAAQEAGVKRLIYLSSAVVHGQAPLPGTTEDSALINNQPLAYNRAKVLAEIKLRQLRQSGQTEIVILRPSIVFGPRSRFTAGVAEQILHGRLGLLNDGAGICNSIYIDNLVDAIKLCLQASDIDGQAFLLTDAELVTWADFYRPLVEALGVDFSQLPRISADCDLSQSQDLVASLRNGKAVQKLLPFMPHNLKAAIKGFLSGWQGQNSSADCTPIITAEMALLQKCQYKLPINKAQNLLGYQPAISFSEGCKRSIAWLEFAGYPLTHKALKDLHPCP